MSEKKTIKIETDSKKVTSKETEPEQTTPDEKTIKGEGVPMKALEAKLESLSVTAADSATLSLATRMDALQQHIRQLEEKTTDCHREVHEKLSHLSAKVDEMKASSKTSLDLNTIGITATEGEAWRSA